MRFGVLGAGAWGTTVGQMLAENGHTVMLWSHSPERAADVQATRHNFRVPELVLSDAVTVTSELALAVQDVDGVIVALNSDYYSVIDRIAELKVSACPVLSLTKGIVESDPIVFPSDYISRVLGAEWDVAVLSGPNLAAEISQRLPAACTIASQKDAVAKLFQSALSLPYFRAYTSTDTRGVELAGVMKNVLAIAAGVSDGLGLGHNAKSALLTRGMREMVALLGQFDAMTETAYGLAGLGDLLVTAMSQRSRNWTVGFRIGQGESLDHVVSTLGSIAEGVRSTQLLFEQPWMNPNMYPITHALHRVLFDGLTSRQAIEALMLRELKPE